VGGRVGGAGVGGGEVVGEAGVAVGYDGGYDGEGAAGCDGVEEGPEDYLGGTGGC